MKHLKITPPEGYEIDKEKSTFEDIIYKKIKSKYPLSIKEIPNRNWYISSNGNIEKLAISSTSSNDSDDNNDINNMSSEGYAKAISTLMQLLELRDAWNQGWKASWEDGNLKHTIIFVRNEARLDTSYGYRRILVFKSKEIRDKFFYQFKSMIEKIKCLF